MSANQKSDRLSAYKQLSRKQRSAVVWQAAQTVRRGDYQQGEDWAAIVERIASTADLATLVAEHKSDEENHCKESVLYAGQHREISNFLPSDRSNLPLAF